MEKRIYLGAFIILIFDQITKFIVEYFFKNTKIVIIKNFFAIDFAYNSGASFSILSNQRILLIIITLISLWILYKIKNDIKPSKVKTLAFSLLFGGILGNLIDRIFIGKVRDFFDFAFFTHHFPTFNIADIAIVSGIIFLFLILIFNKGEKAYAND